MQGKEEKHKGRRKKKGQDQGKGRENVPLKKLLLLEMSRIQEPVLQFQTFPYAKFPYSSTVMYSIPRCASGAYADPDRSRINNAGINVLIKFNFFVFFNTAE